MTQIKNDIMTPVGGRLVSGSPYIGQDKDKDGNPLIVKKGPNQGQPYKKYYTGVAVPKDGRPWEQTEWGQTIMNVSKSVHPACFDPATGALMPGRNFSFKITDGDSQEHNEEGRRPCDYEGYPGHWVLHFSNSYKPKCYDRYGQNELTEEVIKLGHYVQVMAYVKTNDSTTRPGVHLNTKFIAHSAFGQEIVKGIQASEVGFGAGDLPAGASDAPVQGIATGGGEVKYIYNGQEYDKATILSWAGWTEQHLENLEKVEPPAPTPPPQQQASPTPPPSTPASPGGGNPPPPATDLVQPGAGNPPPPPAENNPPPPPAQEMYEYNGQKYDKTTILNWPGWTEAHLANLKKV